MTDGLTHAEIREALNRVVACEAFRNAPQLTGFLTFVVEKTLAGEGHSIKGYTIATQALGRRDDFDPQTDPIVRVEAGRLRRTLDAYYTGPGATDPVRIVIPRGNYVPQFIAMEAISPPGHDTPEPDPLETAPHTPPAADLRTGDAPELAFAPPAPTRDPGEAPKPSWRGAAVVGLLAGVVAVILAALHYNDTGWLARAVRAPLARPSAAPGAADGRPVVVVGAVEASRVPHGFGPALRGLVLDRLARFDEVAVIDPATGQSGLGEQRYGLALQVAARSEAPEVMARLTHEPSGEVVWARSFEVPAAGGEAGVAQAIAQAIGQPYGVLFADLRTRPDLSAQASCILRTFDYRSNPSPVLHGTVRDCLESLAAVQIPSPSTLAGLTFVYLDEYRSGSSAPEPLNQALAMARRAVELGPESPRANQALMAALFASGDREAALRIGRRAHELNPWDTDIMADLGARLIQAGRYAEGAELIDKAAAGNPAHPSWYNFFQFLAAFMQDDWETAREAAARITAPNYAMGLMAKAIVAAKDGRAAEAKELVTRIVALQPGYARDASAMLAKRDFKPEIGGRLLNALRLAGLRSAS